MDYLFTNFAGKTDICCSQSDPSCCDGCWSDRIYDRFWWKCDRCKDAWVKVKKKKQMNIFHTDLYCFDRSYDSVYLWIYFIRQICIALGARGQLLEYASTYGRIMFVSQPMFMMQTIFYNFFITAEKPSYSLRMSLISGVINIVFDYLFIGVMHYGVAGAAVATAMGEYVGGLVPLIYFARKNNSSRLRLVKPVWRKDILLKTCLNGSSEFMTNASSSVVNMLYNTQLMRLAGADGVAAYGVIMYANFIFAAIYLGYSMGSAPITSYNYGAGNHSELKNMLKKSLSLIAVTGVCLTLISEFFAHPLINIFVGYDADLFAMTLHGFRLYAFVFLINGFNIWASSFFTALNNGVVSGMIAFLRTLLFQIGCIMLLPILLGLNGIWMGVVVAEMLTFNCYDFIFYGVERKFITTKL